MKAATFLIFAILSSVVLAQGTQNLLRDEILSNAVKDGKNGVLEAVLSHPEKYRYQILYTRIDRDKNNSPHFTSFRAGLDSSHYFYPASSVKFLAAILALNKLNELNIPGLGMYSVMKTGAAFSGQTPVESDSTSQNGLPSIAHYIKKLFLVSDNDAYNRLYEFLGQQYLNEQLWRRGFKSILLQHRLSAFLSHEEDRHTNPVDFYNDGRLLYSQPPQFNSSDYINPNMEGIRQGAGYYSKGSLVNEPKDFSVSNRVTVEDLQAVLKTVIFPMAVPAAQGFNLKDDDYDFLYRYMSAYPRESIYPKYSETGHPDNFGKFLMFGDKNGRVPDNIRIFNKIGLAYGYLTDNAYIVDFENGVEFLLTAVIYVNEDGIFNDDKYEYDQTGFPFMGELGRAVYDYELSRKRGIEPDFSRLKKAIGPEK